MKRFLSIALILVMVFAMVIPVFSAGGYTAKINTDAANVAIMTNGKGYATPGFKLFSANGNYEGYAYCADILVDFESSPTVLYDSRTETQYTALSLDQINRIKAALTYIINDPECQNMPQNAYHTLIQLVIWKIGNEYTAISTILQSGIVMPKLQEVLDKLNDDNYLKNYKSMYPTHVKELEFFVNCGGSQPLVRFLIGTLGTSYGSVTATNNYKTPLVVPGSNHFTYAKLKVADLQVGVALDLVVGNKIDKVGTAFVKIVNGKLEITIDGDIYQSKVGAVAYTALPNNKNIHLLKEFSHNNNLTINLPAADKDGYIYLYVHFDTLQFYK